VRLPALPCLALVLALLLGACGDDEKPPADGAVADGAMVDGQPLDAPALDAYDHNPDPERSFVIPNPGNGILANGKAKSTISVRVRDRASRPIAGATATCAASGSGNGLIQPELPSGPDGILYCYLTSTVPEIKQVTVTVNGTLVLAQMPDVQFVP
jgi:Invasin, domain 3